MESGHKKASRRTERLESWRRLKPRRRLLRVSSLGEFASHEELDGEGDDQGDGEHRHVGEGDLTGGEFDGGGIRKSIGDGGRAIWVNPSPDHGIPQTGREHAGTAHERHAERAGFTDVLTGEADHGRPEVADADGEDDGGEIDHATFPAMLSR